MTSFPDLASPLLGFREWRISYRDQLLYGAYYQQNLWQDGGAATRAYCDLHENGAPKQHCDCGLYAYHCSDLLPCFFPWTLSLDAEGVPIHEEVPRRVRGAVVASGIVEVHASGFRAQYARPVLLVQECWASPALSDALHATAERYRCEVVAADKLAERATAYGEIVNKDLLPERL
jgi:hypothetical protein